MQKEEASDMNYQNREAVKQFFKHHLGVAPKEENKSFLTFVISHEKEEILTRFFEELQEKEREFGIADIQLALTSLEEVFLNIARQAEMESAAAEGKLVTLNLTTSETSVEVIRQVSCGSVHVLALSEDVHLQSWGYNEYGQLGRGFTCEGLQGPGILKAYAKHLD